MMGVAALGPGIGALHVIFSVLLNFAGNPSASVAPLKFGPRQFGQSSACKLKTNEKSAVSVMICFMLGTGIVNNYQTFGSRYCFTTHLANWA